MSENNAKAVNSKAGYNPVVDWIVRLVKGALVGIGAIVPGLSGGVLAVVFGIYEPMLRFLANIRHKFLANLRFFLPVGIGGELANDPIGVVQFTLELVDLGDVVLLSTYDILTTPETH